MKNTLFLVLVFLVSTSCQEPKKETIPNTKQEVVENSDGGETLVQKILDLPKLQEMYHSELLERLPLKLVENEFVKNDYTLLKFDKKVRIATLASYHRQNIKDHLILESLQIKNDTAYFQLRYEIEGVNVYGKFSKKDGEWIVQDYSVTETNTVEPTISKPGNTAIESTLTLDYKGQDLSYLSNRYYGNGNYKYVLMAYNGFTNNRSIDRKNDSISIPELALLARDPSLPKLLVIAEAFDKIMAARTIYLEQGRTLQELPRETFEFRTVPQQQKLELLGASKLMYEAVSAIGEHENRPKKAIGQFKQVAEYLEQIANGKIDENGYVLSLVHQRLAHGLGNSIKWAKE